MTGKVISVFSSKGGVGKTLIATNLAATLQTHLKLPTALLTVGPANRDVALMLGAGDVHVRAVEVEVEAVVAAIDELRQTHEFIFVDMGSTLHEVAVATFEHSNLLLLVTTPDIVSIQHVTDLIGQLEQVKFPLRMMQVVINRAESRGNLRSGQIRDQFPVAVLAEIPSDGRLAGLSVNQGVPLILIDESARIKDAFKHLARSLVENTALYVEHCPIDHSQLPHLKPHEASLQLRSVSEESGRTRDADDPAITLKRRIHTKLLERFDLKRMDLKSLNDPRKIQQLREQAARMTLELLAEEGGFVSDREQRERFVQEIVNDAMGLGPLEELMADETISDILVNGKEMIYIEKRGKLYRTDKRFISNDQVLTVIERIIAPLGRRIDESNPMVDARLPDGSRVNAIIPPLSLKGPMLSIRKFGRERYVMQDLIRLGSLNSQMAEFISLCVRGRKNIIVSGGTGSGKTTVLNVLSASIPKGERIITIEDAAELRLVQDHWVPLEARPPNIEGRGQITMRHLFRNALRMRPDRIIIGECRGDETLDMLQAMNTGHDGSLTTLHANSPHDVISRLDSLVLMSNVELPVRAIREQIAAAIHLIVHTARLSDGSRKITRIAEIQGMDQQTDIMFADLFVFHQQGLGPNGDVLGEFKSTGQLPSFLEEFKSKGLPIDEAMFRTPVSADLRV